MKLIATQARASECLKTYAAHDEQRAGFCKALQPACVTADETDLSGAFGDGLPLLFQDVESRHERRLLSKPGVLNNGRSAIRT